MGSNAYQLDIPQGKYGVHASFNVADLSLFVPHDDSDDELRTIHDQVEENDSPKIAMTFKDVEDKLRAPFDGPIIKTRARLIKEGTRALLVCLQAIMSSTSPPPWITCISHRLEATSTRDDESQRS